MDCCGLLLESKPHSLLSKKWPTAAFWCGHRKCNFELLYTPTLQDSFILKSLNIELLHQVLYIWLQNMESGQQRNNVLLGTLLCNDQHLNRAVWESDSAGSRLHPYDLLTGADIQSLQPICQHPNWCRLIFLDDDC